MRLLRGVVLRKTWAQNSYVPTLRGRNFKVAVFSCALEAQRLKTRSSVQVRNLSDYKAMQQVGVTYAEEAAEALDSSGVEIVFCQWGIDLELCHLLASKEIAVVTWVAGHDLERVAMAVSAVICPRVQDLKAPLF